jgi:hypothetical protein
MKWITTLGMAATFLFWIEDTVAENASDKLRALRLARHVARAVPSSEVTSQANTNFDGAWAGRYWYSPQNSTCPSNISSIDFRHLLVTRGGSGVLRTNHAGDFNGASRDKGRRWEFTRAVSVGGRPAILAVVYLNLARNGGSAGSAYGVSVGACRLVFVGNALRQSR